ncbi:MAG: YncE family protein [Candidatus Accumulibacter phosphatis]
MKRFSNLAAAAIVIAFSAQTAWAGMTVYIPLGSANKVIAVDAASNRITATFDGVDNPHGLVATPDGEYLVAGSLSETPLPAGAAMDTANSNLAVIHPAHGHVMSTIPVAGWTHHQAITPDGRYVLSTHPTRGGISVTDLIENKVVHTVATGPAPNYAVVTPDGKRVYVSNSGNGTISEIATADWKVTRTLDAGASPEHMLLAPDGKRLYVANARSGTVSAVSLESGKVERDYVMGKRLHGLDISDDGRQLFVSLISEDKLVALDPQTDVRRVLALTPAPYHLGAVRGTGKLYVSSRKEPKIWVVDQSSLEVLDTIRLPGGEGHQLAIVP